jgi:predicted nucleic acid-binding protein
MFVPDSTAWIDFSHGKLTAQTDIMKRELVFRRLVVTDIIIMEFLQGFREDRDYANGVKFMRGMVYKSFYGRRHMEQAAANYRTLRKRGITIRKPNDVVIATFCIENGFTLIHHDRDFDPMEQYLGLLVAH